MTGRSRSPSPKRSASRMGSPSPRRASSGKKPSPATPKDQKIPKLTSPPPAPKKRVMRDSKTPSDQMIPPMTKTPGAPKKPKTHRA